MPMMRFLLRNYPRACGNVAMRTPFTAIFLRAPAWRFMVGLCWSPRGDEDYLRKCGAEN